MLVEQNADLIPRSREGRYDLYGEIARGGMGAILKGHDNDLGRDLAIKVLLETHRNKAEIVERFIEEAQIGGQLQHPGIAPVYELGMFQDDRPYFTMKLVKGKNLADLLAARSDLSEDRSKYLGIFEQVCQTMAYAHSRGVIHRDLKPANIMVGAFGEVQVMDWGLAKVLPSPDRLDAEADSAKKSGQRSFGESIIETFRSDRGAPDQSDLATQMGSVLGTPAYMPPEQALGEVDRLNERCDVFALGGLLVHILTGKAPYFGANSTEVYRKATRGNLRDCLALLDESQADTALLDIARKCLQTEPIDRYSNAREVADQVNSYLESVEQRLRKVEVEKAEQSARAEESLRTAENAIARATAERRTRRLQLGIALVLLSFVVLGAAITSVYLKEKQLQAQQIADALTEKSDSLYVAHLQMAQQNWRDGAIRRSRELLDREQTNSVGGDRRSFEWFLLDKLCRAVEATPQRECVDIISNVVVAPNGQFACLAFDDNSVGIVDLKTLAQTASLVGHKRKVLNITISEDGKTILTSDEGNEFRAWVRGESSYASLVSGPSIQTHHLRLSPDARYLIVPQADAIALYDLTLQKPEPSITALLPVTSTPSDLVWLNDEQHFLSAHQDGTIQAYDLRDLGEPKRLLSLGQPGTWMVVSADDRHLALGTQDSVKLYSLSDSQEAELTHDLGRPDGKFIYLTHSQQMFAAVTDRTATFWDFKTGALGGRIQFDSSAATRLAVSLHSEIVATASGDHLVKIWDPKTGHLQSVIKGHSNTVYGVDFTDKGKVVSGGRDKVLQVADMSETTNVMTLSGHTARIWSIDYSPLGEQIASGSEDKSVMIWDAKTGRQLQRLEGHSQSVQYVRYCPKNTELASASRDATIKLWDWQSGKLTGELQGHKGAVNSIDYSPDGSRLVSGSDDGSVIVWDTIERRPLHKLENIPGKIWAVAYASDNSILLGGTNHKLLHWNPGSTQAPAELLLSDFNITSLRFSLDGNSLACTISDGTFALIDYPRRIVTYRPTSHTSDAIMTAFSPDGRTLASCGSDAKIHFWNRKLMEPTLILDAHAAHIHSIDFSPDGANLASGSWDNTLKIWSTK